MYKLLIADDESLEREAVKLFVNESKLDIDEIIDCATGTEAVKLVMLEKPDIIILDINMPGLTGLEVMEHVVLANYNCKVIFSTAFNYFEYAVKALQLGAMDFIVKPVKRDSLVMIINKAIDQLDEEMERSHQSHRVKKMMDYMGKRIMGELVCGNITQEVLYYLDMVNIDVETCCGNCFCFMISSEPNREERDYAIKTIEEEMSIMGFSLLTNWKNRMLTIVVMVGEEMASDTVYTTMKDVIFAILKKLSFSYTVGIGSVFTELIQIEQSYNHARGMIGGLQVEKKHEKPTVDNGATSTKVIADYIEAHYRQKISLDDLALIVGYSKYHMNRLFKEEIGTTIGDYIIQVRLSKAKELLKDESYSVKKISGMVGYSEPNYFTWTFKKIEGITPVEYRYSNQ